MRAPAAVRVVALVAGREVRQRSRSRAFVVITAVLAVGVALLATLPILSAVALGGGEDRVGPPLVVGVVGADPADLDPAFQGALEAVVEDSTVPVKSEAVEA